MKIGLLFVVLAFAVVNGGNRAMYIQGAKYQQPDTCTGSRALNLKGACSVVPGLNTGCCGESFEVGLPQIGELCTRECVSLFLAYWCTRGCNPTKCIRKDEIESLLNACTNCRNITFTSTQSVVALPGPGQSSDLATDTSLTLGDQSNCTAIASVGQETAQAVYRSSALNWNGGLVNTTSGRLTFDSPNGTLGVLVTIVSDLPPKATVSISISDNVFPKVTVASVKSLFGLWNKTDTSGGTAWSQLFNFWVADVTAYTGKMEIALNVSNSAGQGQSPTLFTLTTSTSASAPTRIDNIEQCTNTNGIGELGYALLGQVLVKVNSITCNCEFCGIYKTGTDKVEVTTLRIGQSLDYYMWGADVAVNNLIIPSTLRTFGFLSGSRLRVRGSWTIKQSLTFNGDGSDNRLIFESLVVGLQHSTQRVLLNNIRAEVYGLLSSGNQWLLRNKSRLIAANNGRIEFGDQPISVSSTAGIGDSSDPTISIRSTSFTGALLNLSGSGWVTIGPGGKLDMPISLSKTGNPASPTRSKMSVQQSVGNYPWNNFTVQTFATGGTVGKGSIVIDDGTAFNIDTTASITVTTANIQASGDTISTTDMEVKTNGYLVHKNVDPSSRPFNLRGRLTLRPSSKVVAEVAANSAWPINFVQVSLFRFEVTAGTCTSAVYNNVNMTIVNCPVGRNCTLGVLNESNANGINCRLTLDMAATTAPTTTTAESDGTYSITIERDCDWADRQFARAIVEYYSERELAYENIKITRLVCGSTTINFKCRDTTISSADALCKAIVNFAENKNSPLNLALGVTNIKSNNPRGSDSGIFALYSLMFIPCCMACILIGYYKAKQQKADDQYLQDTATFSNLAHNKGPAPMPPPQGFQPAPPVQYYPEPAYAPQPYPVAPPVYQTGYQQLPTGYPAAAPYGYA